MHIQGVGALKSRACIGQVGDTHPGFDIPGLGSLPSLVRPLFIERIVVNLALPAGRYKAVVCSQACTCVDLADFKTYSQQLVITS